MVGKQLLTTQCSARPSGAARTERCLVTCRASAAVQGWRCCAAAQALERIVCMQQPLFSCDAECLCLPSTSEHRAGEPECQAVRGTWVHCGEPGVWATRRLAALLRGTQAAGHGKAVCRLCTILLLGCAMQCAAAHGPRGHGLARRKTSNIRNARQMAARRLQALGTWAIAESDVARTDSKTWYVLLKSVSHTKAQKRAGAWCL